MRLQNKIAIVTGAASGIGKATVALFEREGATVVAADVNASDGVIAADAGKESDVVGLIELAQREHGGLDIFFANAGISGGLASIFEQTPEDWHEILRVNLVGPWLAIKHAAPAMQARGGGSIIATASVAGIRAGAGGPAYSASKAGRDQPGRSGGDAIVRRQYQGQRHLPRTDRDRHDPAALRHGAGRWERVPDRPPQPAEARRHSRRDRRGRFVPRLGRVRATSTATPWSSTAASAARTRTTNRNMDERPFDTGEV